MTPTNFLTAACTHNYKHVRPVMKVCVMKHINIGTVISQALKLAMTRSRMLFVPKQRGRHLLALPCHSQSMSKVPLLFGTAVCCYCIRRSDDEEKKNVRKYIHNKDIPAVCRAKHTLYCELNVKRPIQTKT